jgi:hypothetical protein
MDCNEDCGGFAIIDDCGICSGGNTGFEYNEFLYCSGECFGDAVEDCAGECNGTAEYDDCDVCDGGNADMDCAGNCFGNAVEDCAGECNGNDFEDCNGDCSGIDLSCYSHPDAFIGLYFFTEVNEYDNGVCTGEATTNNPSWEQVGMASMIFNEDGTSQYIFNVELPSSLNIIEAIPTCSQLGLLVVASPVQTPLSYSLTSVKKYKPINASGWL